MYGAKGKDCPPVRVEFDAIVEAARKAVLKDLDPQKHASPVAGSVNLMGLKIVESPVRPVEMILGFATIPPVVNFATKLSQVGVLLPQVDLGVARGGALAATLVATIMTGGESFLVGALVGQIPTTLDSLFDIFIAPIAKARLMPQPPPPPAPRVAQENVAGLGATEEEQLRMLRQDLDKMSGVGSGVRFIS